VLQRGWSTTSTIAGSAFVELGGSKVVCYAYAPRPSTGKNVQFEEGVLECRVFFGTHLVPAVDLFDDVLNADRQVSVLERLLALAVVDAVSPAVRRPSYPKMVLGLAVVVLQSSVQDLACAITAASLALCDAAVEMRDLVAAFTVEQQQQQQPPGGGDRGETAEQSFRCTVAAMCAADDLTFVQSSGSRSPDMLLATVELAKQQCQLVRAKVSEYLKVSFNQAQSSSSS
jgi:ribonuclease PH